MNTQPHLGESTATELTEGPTEPIRPAQPRRWSVYIERALWLVALLALGVAGLAYADAALYQSRHRDLDFSGDAGRRAVVDMPAGDEPRRVIPIADLPLDTGTPIARIEVPRLGLTATVAEGITSSVLRRAVGRVPGSALPGQADNVVLAAHRDTFFRPLEGIEAGDLVVLESAAGRDEYVVEWTAIVEPHDVSVAGAVGYSSLTLVTCYPFYFVGDAPQRFIVRARQRDELAAGSARTEPSRPTAGATGG
jgi:sortase A